MISYTQDLPENQCIFIRGFRVFRKLGMLPRQLRGAARSNSSLDEDQDDEPDKEPGSIPSFTKARDSS
jgi:hypothetical protein